jgi:Flp pilus assembly protein TadD
MRTPCSFSRQLVPLAVFAALLPLAQGKQPESPWLEIRTPHFSVITDAGEKKGKEVALRFEQMRAVFAGLLLKQKFNDSFPLQILALKNDKQYDQLAPGRSPSSATAGFMLRGDPPYFIVLDLFELEPWRDITHDLAHVYLDGNYPATEPWFDEGMAEYFGSVRVDDKQVSLGSDPEIAVRSVDTAEISHARPRARSLTELLQTPVWLSMDDLFRIQRTGPESANHRTMFYAQSWITIHYLIAHNQMSAVGSYFDLIHNQRVPVPDAMQRAFGMNPQQFEKAVRDYFVSLKPLAQAADAASRGLVPDLPLYQTPAPVGPQDVTPVVRPVSELDARVLANEVLLRQPDRRAQATSDLQAIAQQETDSISLYRALGFAALQKQDFKGAIEQLQNAVDRNAKDPWIYYYLALAKYRAARAGGNSYEGLANMIQGLKIVLDAYPEFAEAYNLLGLARIEGGGTASALEAMRIAIQLNPRDPWYTYNLGEVYLAGRKWDDARQIFEQMKNHPNSAIASSARQRLEDLQTVKKYGVMPQPAAQAPKELEEEERRPGEAPPDTRRTQYVKGRILAVDCTHPPVAILTLAAAGKNIKLRAADKNTVVLIGAGSFSCNWRNMPASVNYKAGGQADGDIVSLEVQP